MNCYKAGIQLNENSSELEWATIVFSLSLPTILSVPWRLRMTKKWWQEDNLSPDSQPKIFHHFRDFPFYVFASSSEQTLSISNIRECFGIYVSRAIFFILCPEFICLVKKRRKLSPKLGRAVFFPHKMSKTWKFSVFYLEIDKSHGKKKCSPSKIGRGGRIGTTLIPIPGRPEASKRLGGRIDQIDNFRAPAAALKRPQLSWNFAWK